MSKFWKMSGSVMELSSEATSERTGSGHGRSHNIRYRREPSHEDEVKDIVLERQLIDVLYLDRTYPMLKIHTIAILATDSSIIDHSCRYGYAAAQLQG